MMELERKLELVKDIYFTLNFTYPTSEQIKYLNIVQRNQQLANMADDLENSKMHARDMPVETRERLVRLLQVGKNE